jgi:nucleoside-diphosphate kinase
MVEKTLAIIKPDGVAAGNADKIINLIKQKGFKVLEQKKTTLSRKQAEDFYAVHKSRPFFGELVAFMSSGPVVVMALEKENAIEDWRKLMGDTNPEKAGAGTIRKLFGANIGNNAVHGSDSPATAAAEVKFFFPSL